MQADPNTTQRIMEAFEAGNVLGFLKPRFRRIEGDFRGVAARAHHAKCTANTEEKCVHCRRSVVSERGRVERLCSAGCDRRVQRTSRGVVKGSRETGFYFYPVCEQCAHAILGINRNQMFEDARPNLATSEAVAELERKLDLLTVLSRKQAAYRIAALMPKPQPAPKAEASDGHRVVDKPKSRRNRRRGKRSSSKPTPIVAAASPAAATPTPAPAAPAAESKKHESKPAPKAPALSPEEVTARQKAFCKDVELLKLWAVGREGAPVLAVRDTCGFEHPCCEQDPVAGLIQLGPKGFELVGICASACRVYDRVVRQLGRRAPRLWENKTAAEAEVKRLQGEYERRQADEARREAEREAARQARYDAAKAALTRHFAEGELEEPKGHRGHKADSVKWTVRRTESGGFIVVQYCGMAHYCACEAMRNDLGERFRGLKRFESREEAEDFAAKLARPRRGEVSVGYGPEEGNGKPGRAPRHTGKTRRKRMQPVLEREAAERAAREAEEKAAAAAKARADADAKAFAERVAEVAAELECSAEDAEALVRDERKEAEARAKAEAAKRDERKAGAAEDRVLARVDGRKPRGKNGHGSGDGHANGGGKNGSGEGGERKAKPRLSGNPLDSGSGAGINDLVGGEAWTRQARREMNIE